MTDVPAIRIARPTNDIARLIPFYQDGLGLSILGSFDDHEGFDGIMFGTPGAPYHLEFTCERHTIAELRPHADALIVLYLGEAGAYEAAVTRLEGTGFAPIRAHNPYWDRGGKTYADPDGNRVVLFNGNP